MVNDSTRRGRRHDRDSVAGDVHAGEQLAELIREIGSATTVEEVLESVVAAVVREVPGAQFCGITVLSRDGAVTPAASDDLVVRVDSWQYTTGQGPCLQAADTGVIVRTDDLRSDPRWPRFAQAAAAEGVRSVLAFPLFTETGTIGALNIYSRTEATLGMESERIGFLMAAHAATAIVATRTTANLRIALDSRDVIGQAKGILMERYKIDADRAFSLLLRRSQETNVKLAQIARHLAATGELA